MLLLGIGVLLGCFLGYRFGEVFNINRKSDNNTHKVIRDGKVNKSQMVENMTTTGMIYLISFAGTIALTIIYFAVKESKRINAQKKYKKKKRQFT